MNRAWGGGGISTARLVNVKRGVKRRTHQRIGVLEEKQPLEAVPLERLGHPLPQKKVVHVAVPVRLCLKRERVALGQYEARRTVA